MASFAQSDPLLEEISRSMEELLEIVNEYGERVKQVHEVAEAFTRLIESLYPKFPELLHSRTVRSTSSGGWPKDDKAYRLTGDSSVTALWFRLEGINGESCFYVTSTDDPVCNIKTKWFGNEKPQSNSQRRFKVYKNPSEFIPWIPHMLEALTFLKGKFGEICLGLEKNRERIPTIIHNEM